MGIWHITLPRRITPVTAKALRRDFSAMVRDKSCEGLVLAGENGAFCEGLDFTSLNKPASTRKAVSDFADCLRILRGSPKPVLAAIDGRTLGGGLGLAAACDGVIASNRSLFALPEVLFGLTPALIAPFALERMTPRKFELWGRTGGSHDAHEAQQAGLVDEIVSAEDLEQAATRWLRSLVRPSAETIKRLKALTGDAARREALLKKGIAETTRALADKKLKAALRAFAKDGIPPWETP
jgi:enoyl-CoA hydratase/carnithine racemase